jgi:threonylcarbamoyladenosine tRNA methylthiotransferase MtaB
MTSFSLQNFGCRVNQAEAFDWAEEFQRAGLRLERDPVRSDVIVVNTCTLTARADRDVRKFLARVNRKNPRARVFVTGCLVDRARAELEVLPNTTLLANGDKGRLASLITRLARGGAVVPPASYRARAMLKVQDGCDCRCTFCIIPAVRGHSRSVHPAAALRRLGELADQGFREVVLTGIHLNSYGRDLRPQTSLLELLRDMEKFAGSLHLRLSSLDPRSLDAELVDFLARSPLIRPHFHLSLQHGSDMVLARMGRKSRADEYRHLLEGLRQRSPQAGLGADIITGFPGEGENEFRAARDFLSDSPLTYLHVFSYSARPGTAAASWGRVDPAVVRSRTTDLRGLSVEKCRAFRRSFLGRSLEAIVIRQAGSRLELYTANGIKVIAEGRDRPQGEAVSVTVTGTDDRAAYGTLGE